ncbi:MAG: hypothetical protein IJ781_13985, partial [Atopobiaceae bacterium]|nr:hypothetical protein [Atopobiaceae bacterium]
GDLVWDRVYDTIARVTAISTTTTLSGVLELARLRGLIETTLDVAPGEAGSGTTDVGRHALKAGTLLLNVASGNLMRVRADVQAPYTGSTATVAVEGVGNVYAGGSSLAAQSPLSIDDGVISIDLSGYATTQYVDDAIAALDDLSEEEF